MQLQNNIWNTNFPQWYPFEEEDSDAQFRFEVRITAGKHKQLWREEEVRLL